MKTPRTPAARIWPKARRRTASDLGASLTATGLIPMPRDGAITFGDLVGKLDALEVACDKCGRKGRYAVARLMERRGADGRLTELLTELRSDCPKLQADDFSDRCGACCPDLPRVM